MCAIGEPNRPGSCSRIVLRTLKCIVPVLGRYFTYRPLGGPTALHVPRGHILTISDYSAGGGEGFKSLTRKLQRWNHRPRPFKLIFTMRKPFPGLGGGRMSGVTQHFTSW